MGRSKAMLPFGPETLLERVVRLLGEAVDVTVVVAAPGQKLPELPPSVVVAHDRQPDRGPLEGLAVGLQILADRAVPTGEGRREKGEGRGDSGESPGSRPSPPAPRPSPPVSAFVTACDVPLLKPVFVRRMIELSAGHEIAVPHVGGFDQPLAAVYHISVLPYVEALLEADRLRPAFLFDQVSTRRVTADELTDVDPELQSLANVNSPEEYRAILARAGFPDETSAGSGLQSRTPEEESKKWPRT
jgi:molybdopterin-guanine dinucleotide biosynthesis protein A